MFVSLSLPWLRVYILAPGRRINLPGNEERLILMGDLRTNLREDRDQGTHSVKTLGEQLSRSGEQLRITTVIA